MMQAQNGLRIINEGAELIRFGGRQLVAQPELHFFPDHAGAVVHDVAEGLILAVDIAHEVLGALGQVQLSVDPGDFGAQRFHRGILFSQQFQILQAFRGDRLAHRLALLC